MQNQIEFNSQRVLRDTLRKSPVPLSTRELGVQLRLRHFKLPDYKISNLLRELLRSGQVDLQQGRWTMVSSSDTFTSSTSVALPKISSDTFSFLKWEPPPPPDTVPSMDLKWRETVLEPTEVEYPPGPWSTFRSLVTYYRQCIRNEEGADAAAFQNQLGSRFIYLRKVGQWYPRPGQSWRLIIPLGPHMSKLLNALPAQSEDQALVVGYPVQGFYKLNEEEPDVSIIRPIFFFAVDQDISNNGLTIKSDDPRPEVNLNWLEYAFSRNPDRQRSFLSACGFINRWQPNDEAPGLERGEMVPGLDNLVAALAAFIPEKVRQPLDLENVPDHPLSEPFETGIYNRAVLMLARRTKYNATLLKELAVIEKAPDDMLDRTALRHIFVRSEDRTPSETEEILHEAIVADSALLNADQRRASASLLTRDVTLVTGPPGTGKSQVVSSTVANARLREQTVLFASRNHKAIDAVINRLTDADGRSLMVRTNSKTDPNLNVTFNHAIRDMLAEQRDSGSAERMARTKEELSLLLDERGRKASSARKAADLGIILGEIEERLSYLAREMPQEMLLFL